MVGPHARQQVRRVTLITLAGNDDCRAAFAAHPHESIVAPDHAGRFAHRHADPAREIGHRRAEAVAELEVRSDTRGGVARLEIGETRRRVRIAATVALGVDEQDRAAADRALTGLIAKNEAIARSGHDGRIGQDDLRERGLFRRDRLRVSQPNEPRQALARSEVQPDALVRPQRTSRSRADLHPRVEALRPRQRFRGDHGVAARDGIEPDPGEVQGDALARIRSRNASTMNLHLAHARTRAAWRDGDFVSGADAAARRRPGHHDAVSLQHEHAVDGESKRSLRRAATLEVGKHPQEVSTKVRHSRARDRGHGEDRRSGERRSIGEHRNLRSHIFDPRGGRRGRTW